MAPGYYEQGGATVPHGPLTTEETAPAADGACFHGGVSWEATGLDFAKRDALVVADVLDAPFPPPPELLAELRENLPRLVTEAPPTHSEPLVAAVAEARGLDPSKILCSSGSSSLLFSLLPRLLDANSRVLLLRPTYGEYEHVLRHVVGCHVDSFDVNPDTLELDAKALATVAPRYDAVFLVNPNSPTGKHCPDLGAFIDKIKGSKTWAWVDETYIDYVADVIPTASTVRTPYGVVMPAEKGVSLEPKAGPNLYVLKSLSKVVGLSGLRAAYVVGDVAPYRRFVPPWAVPLPAQLAAVRALTDHEAYYRAARAEVCAAREELEREVAAVLPAAKVHEGCANFFLVDLPDGMCATDVVERCRELGVYLRAVGDDRIRIAVRNDSDNKRIALALLEVSGEEDARRVA